MTSKKENTGRGPGRGYCHGLRVLLWLVSFVPCAAALQGAETWQDALAKMPVGVQAEELNRSNCVEIMLSAFQSNAVVKALVFMPGATDEFYLFRRARAALTNSPSSLLDAVIALTNQTFIQATFRSPFLLLHTTEDPLEPVNIVLDQRTEAKLKEGKCLGHLRCNDRDWDSLQPVLKHSLRINLRPWRYSNHSWHFYRHSFAVWNVDGLEALEIVALAGKTRFALRRGEAIFEEDQRVQSAPTFDAH